MRALLIGPLVALGLLIAVAAAVVPNLIDAEGYRADVAARALALTGRELRIDGEVELSLLPQPTLTVTRASLAPPPGGAPGPAFRLAVERLDLHLAALPLLRGELQPLGLRLVRPVLTAEAPAADGGALALLYAALRGAGGPAPPPDADVPPRRIVVVDGELVIAGEAGADAPPARRFEQVNLDLGAESAAGPLVLAADFRHSGRVFSVAAEVGRLDRRRNGLLRLELSAQGPDGSTAGASYGGTVRFGPEGPELRGDLEVEGGDLRRGAALLGTWLDGGDAPAPAPGDAAAPPPAGLLGEPFAVQGELELTPVALALDDLAVEVGDYEATGRLAIGLAAAEPRFDLRLRVPELGLAEVAPALLPPAAGWPAPPEDLSGAVEVTVASVTIPGGPPIRRLRLDVVLPGDGRAVVERASAVLPGNTDVDFAGVYGPVAEAGGVPLLGGSLEAATDDLRALLDWLGLATSAVPRGRLRTLTFAGDVALTPALLRLSRAELRFDASTLVGSMALGLGPRLGVAVAATLDRFNADAYLPEPAAPPAPADDGGDADGTGAPQEAPAAAEAKLLPEAWREAALWLDAALDARVERLTWGGRRMQGVEVQGRLEEGVVTLDELTVADLAELRLRLAGVADLVEEDVELEVEMGTARPVRTLRLLDLDPPPTLASFAPVRLTGTAAGPLGGAAFELDVSAGELELALSGEAAAAPAGAGLARLDASWQASHPGLPDLLRQLGVLGVPEDDLAGPVQLAGGLEAAAGEAFRTRFAGTLGPMAVDGELGWDDAGPRPRLDLDASAEPLVAELPATLAAAGAPGRGGPFAPGDLSRRRFDPSTLDAVDLALEVATDELRYGGRALGPLELTAALEDGVFELRRFVARPFGGRMQARARLAAVETAAGGDGDEEGDREDADGNRGAAPPLALELGLELDRVDAGPVLGLLDVPEVLRGPADVRLTATSVGRSPFELVGGLGGELEVRIREGRLAGVDLAPVRRVLDADPPPEPLNMARLRSDLMRGDTPFALFGGILDLDRGILRATELGAVLEEDGVATVDGIIDLVFWAADLTLELAPDGTDGLPAVGVRIVGPLGDPQTVPRLGELDAYLAAQASPGWETTIEPRPE